MTGPAIQQAITAIAAGQCHRVALVNGNNGATANSTYGGFVGKAMVDIAMIATMIRRRART
ncbi:MULTISPECIES: hypothetical protein [Rhodococcus]|uniref:Uncharacterized protein n=1 Tax=Rhodococcus wratislaviensis NBRC 100605 TaxID=1219028 RepID=X0QBP5_RHOWR|nr:MULTISPECIES: hypothetical protein [Rhodococcus]WAM14716.1 hypothetical protein OYT95_35930 [Rhodococcus sp. JS3073]GAF48997.1 hypothetical protein RW1_065_00020 [Rhodococcus wratislaviensis NBRC 100605]